MQNTSLDMNTIIALHYNEFSKTEIKVADYVLAHSDAVLNMTITELATACEVSDTTVFRFCRVLELDGYQAFKVLLAQSLVSSSYKNRMFYSDEIQSANTVEAICRATYNDTVFDLNNTFELINYQNLEKAVCLIEKADRIHFFGSGASGDSAMDARNKFIRILPNVDCIIDSHIQLISASMMRPTDVAIIYSYGGSSKNILEVMRLAKENNVPTVAITRFLNSPITKYADIVLLCGSNEGPLQGGSTASRISQIFWTDILYNVVFQRNYEQCSINKTQTAKAVSSMLL